MTDRPPSEIEAEFRAKTQKMVADGYKKTLKLFNLKDTKLQEFLEPKLEERHLAEHGIRDRLVRNGRIAKYAYTTTKTNVITTTFKVVRGGASCIYGFLHSTCDDIARKQAFVHQFVSTGPTFRSQDGEYRGRLIHFDQVNKLFEKYGDVVQPVEELVLSKVENEIQFVVETHYPAKCKVNRAEFKDQIDSLRLSVRLYILCWVYDFDRIHLKREENHMHPTYKAILYNPDDASTLELLKSNKNEFNDLWQRVGCYWSDINIPLPKLASTPTYGQKICPISVLETANLDDINFNIWKEIYAMNSVANQVLNLVSPSFPILGNWFYVHDSDNSLFDNSAMHDKYLHSEVAESISSQLRTADHMNYLNNDMSQSYRDPMFKRLSKDIRTSMLYADTSIRMSKLSICFTTEYCGRTIRDLPMIIAEKLCFPNMCGFFSDDDLFCKHMFEFVYAMYNMNIKSGVLHGDLHLNNATVNFYKELTFGGKNLLKNPRAVYILGNVAYHFRHLGCYSTIIDFSRAVLGNREKLTADFGAPFTDAYFVKQVPQLIHILKHHLPDVAEEHKDILQNIDSRTFDLVFKILTAVDSFTLMSNITALVNIDECFVQKRIEFSDASRNLLTGISSRAEALIRENMGKMARGEIKKPEDIEWPNLLIIREMFAGSAVGDAFYKDDTVTIVDIFNSNNPLVYDFADMSLWGPIVTIDPMVKLRKQMGMPMITGYKEWLEYSAANETDDINELLAEYTAVRSEYKDLDNYDDWMMM